MAHHMRQSAFPGRLDRRFTPWTERHGHRRCAQICALIAVFFLALGAGARAQDAPPAGRGAQLERLAYILGQVHHLRGRCARGEAEVWRARMQRLSELERMGEKARKALIETFNSGFYAARTQHPECDERAGAAAIALATEGRQLAAMLAPARVQTSQQGKPLDADDR